LPGVVALGEIVLGATPDTEGTVPVSPVVPVVDVPLFDLCLGDSEARIWSACTMKLCQMIAG
jgi:hypothetical protein